jgi:hypothetical protein
MMKVLAVLSLVLSLMVPHLAGADSSLEANSHHGMASMVDRASDVPSGGHHHDQDKMLCCDMLAGHCSVVMLVPNSYQASALDMHAITPRSYVDYGRDGFSLSFDPPPPRV